MTERTTEEAIREWYLRTNGKGTAVLVPAPKRKCDSMDPTQLVTFEVEGCTVSWMLRGDDEGFHYFVHVKHPVRGEFLIPLGDWIKTGKLPVAELRD